MVRRCSTPSGRRGKGRRGFEPVFWPTSLTGCLKRYCPCITSGAKITGPMSSSLPQRIRRDSWYVLNARTAPNPWLSTISDRSRKAAAPQDDGFTVQIFLLVPQVKLRKRLDLARDAERAIDGVPGLIVANWLDYLIKCYLQCGPKVTAQQIQQLCLQGVML